MNKRVTDIVLNINKLQIVELYPATQGDTNTHTIKITFEDDVVLPDWELLVYYKLAFPYDSVFVDTFDQLSKEMELPIPNIALTKNTEIRIEFALRHIATNELITINQSAEIQVIRTINATCLGDAIPVNNLEKTITEAIDDGIQEIKDTADAEKVDFLDEAKVEVDEYIKQNLDKLKGDKGDKGSDGKDGATYTPSVSPDGELSWSNNSGLPNPPAVNIKGATGANGADGKDGADGAKGDKGDTGAVFTPSVSIDGTLSWTNNGNLANPNPINIKGERGDQGPQGIQGVAGRDGQSAFNTLGHIEYPDGTEEWIEVV